MAVAGGFGLLFATNEPPAVWRELAPRLMPEGAELAEYADQSRGVIRIAAFQVGRFDGAIFVGPGPTPPQWDAVRSLFETGALTERERRMLLSGRSGEGMVEVGPIICACFGVGLAAIRETIAAGAESVGDVGRALRAGTNCGSCVPELRAIIERTAQAA